MSTIQETTHDLPSVDKLSAEAKRKLLAVLVRELQGDAGATFEVRDGHDEFVVYSSSE